MSLRRMPVVVVAALMLLAGACGDDDSDGSASSEEGSEFTDAIAESMRAEMTDEEAAAFGDSAECLAAGIVDTVGISRLIELGLDLEAIESGEDLEDADLSEEEADSLIDPMLDCLDLGELFLAESGGEISEESADCLGDRFASMDVFRESIVQSMLGNDESDPFESADLEAQAELVEAMTECLSAEELVQIGAG